MKVGVTGATGFVGSELVERLATAGLGVVEFPASGRLDLRDAEAVTRFVGRHPDMDAVIHLAGLAHSPGSSAGDHDEVNRRGTANVVTAMARAGVERLVYVSTANVYDPAHRGAPIPETAPIFPRGAYARSKAAAEKLVLEGVKSSLVLRPPSLYARDWLLNVRKRTYMPGTGARLGIRIPNRPAFSLCARSTLVAVVEHALREPALDGILNVADLQTYRQTDVLEAVL
ncbi:MAG TPA: NAD(P)-dependent oxidoreductase, partial [Longimicrobiales bacterium]|nr:NAD(P)-dependent oxidoreductase [Longimicrobiales bacterium]